MAAWRFLVMICLGTGLFWAEEIEGEQIARSLVDALRDVVAVDTSAVRSIALYQGPDGVQDATAAQLQTLGRAGTLWVFWAHDAPSSALVPPALMAVAEQMPDVAIYDVHMMGVMDWIEQMQHLHEIKELLERRDETLDEAVEQRRKEELVAVTSQAWSGLTRMSEMRRPGGYLLMEDVTPAVALSVRRIPTVCYISPSGTIHRLEGLGQRTDLAAWIRQALAWEAAHMAEYRERL